jgi:hypothetical protein
MRVKPATPAFLGPPIKAGPKFLGPPIRVKPAPVVDVRRPAPVVDVRRPAPRRGR